MGRVPVTIVLSLTALVAAGAALAGYGNPPSRTPDAKAVSMVGKSNTTLLQGIQQAAKHGAVIEAKFELDDSGALSLSTYTAKGFTAFYEVSGPAKAAVWKPAVGKITDPGDLVNSAVDLTVLEQGSIDLATAVQRAAAKQPGFVYWAVPTLQDKQPVVGVYVLDNAGKSHHLYIPLK
jgi:hypothetical protein